jgi:hypothetical protein
MLGLAEEHLDQADSPDATLLKIVVTCSLVQFNRSGGIVALITSLSSSLDLPISKITVFGVDNGRWAS